jgi:hypothetical protein
MPRTCTICSHNSRRKIDAAIVFGKSNRAISRHPGGRPTAQTAVQRHKKHVAAALERANEKRELSIGETILDRLETLYQRCLALLNSGEKGKNHSASASYVRELRSILLALHEVLKTVVPKYADQRAPLQQDYIDAVCVALGVRENSNR